MTKKQKAMKALVVVALVFNMTVLITCLHLQKSNPEMVNHILIGYMLFWFALSLIWGFGLLRDVDCYRKALKAVGYELGDDKHTLIPIEGTSPPAGPVKG